jgi:hypothetical protein
MGKEAIREDVADEGNPDAFEPETELEIDEMSTLPVGANEASDKSVESLRPAQVALLNPPPWQPELRSHDEKVDAERAFASAMRSIYHRADRELDYRPTYFARMLGELGPIETARQLTMASNPSEGFTRLWEEKRMDLTVEAHVVKPEFRGLFDPSVVEAAEERLRAYGYDSRA